MNFRKGADQRDEVYRQIGPLKRLGMDRDVAIVGVHHLKKGKQGENDDPHDMSYGSVGYMQVADTRVILNRVRASQNATLEVSGRDLERKEYGLLFDSTLLTWSIVEDQAEIERISLPHEYARVISAVRYNPGKSATELALILKKTYQATYKMLVKGLNEVPPKLYVKGGKYYVVGYVPNEVDNDSEQYDDDYDSDDWPIKEVSEVA